MTVPQMYDAADSILSQKLAQVDGVGQVFVWGAAQPAVRAEVNPTLLNKLGIGLDTVRNALNAANANRPKGQVQNGTSSQMLDTTDQLFTADQYRPLIMSYNNGAAVRLGDVADVQDAVSDVRNLGLVNGKPGIVMPCVPAAGRQHHRYGGPGAGAVAAICNPRFRRRSSFRS